MIESTLPVYSSEVRGTVRHILILKDYFLLSSKLLEQYCYLGNSDGPYYGREFVLNEAEKCQKFIEHLKIELHEISNNNLRIRKVIDKLRNKLLKIKKYKSDNLMLESNWFEHRNVTNELTSNEHCINIYKNVNDEIISLPSEFDCKNVKTVLEFLKDIFIIQLHFQIVICQGLNFVIPIITANLTTLERIIFWPERPEFGLLNKRILMPDKLRDIQVEIQRVIEELVSVCLLTESKRLYKLKLESYYFQTIERFKRDKHKLMSKINHQRNINEMLLLEHSRLIARITKFNQTCMQSEQLSMGRNVNSETSELKTNISNMDEQFVYSITNDTILPKIKDSNNNKSTANVKNNQNHNSQFPIINNTKVNDEISSKMKSLLELKNAFNLNFKNNFENYKEIKSKNVIIKMRQSIEKIIENDRNYLGSVRKIN